MLIWLASYPRSGNTFFRLLLRNLYGVRTHSLYEEGEDDHEDSSLFPHVFTGKGDASYWSFRDVVGSRGRAACIEALEADSEIHFVKTHGLPTDKAKTIYLIRDGRDTLVSYAHYLLTFGDANKEPGQFLSTLEELVDGRNLFGRWDHHVNQWFERCQEAPTVWLEYEELVRRPLECVASALNRLDLDLRKTSEQMPTFEELNKKWPFFFRKGKSGAWREEMPVELQNTFWDLQGQTMELHGYHRDDGCPEALRASKPGRDTVSTPAAA